MTQLNKMILVAVIAALISGFSVYIGLDSKKGNVPPVVSKNDSQEAGTVPSAQYEKVAQYNCEKSNGVFKEQRCICPTTPVLTQDLAYDDSTGYCRTEHGGPAGDAFAASAGLPYGSFAFWTEVIGNRCKETGGTWLNARCTCADNTVYDKSIGTCSST